MPEQYDHLTAERARELEAAWLRRADQLDAYARTCRRTGDTSEAADAELAATDYRIAAEELPTCAR